MTDEAIYDLLWHLAASPSATTNLSALEPPVLHRFLAIARIHGVLGIVLSQGGDITSSTGATWDNVRRAWKGQLIHSLRVRQHAQNVLESLKQQGIAAVLFKGPDFADHLYPEPRLRATLDVDILVPREQWSNALKVLETMGHREKPDQPNPVVATGVISQRTWIFPISGTAIEVDLHWSLVHFPYFRRQAAVGYWDLDWQWLPGGQGVLTPASRLIIAAVHAVYHHQFDRLLQLVDVQKACAKIETDMEQQKVRALAERTGTRLALDVALQITARFLDDPAVERLRRTLLGDPLPWQIPAGLFQDARANLRSIRTSYFTPGARRIREWLMSQPLRPQPGWEFQPPASSVSKPPVAPRTVVPSPNASPWVWAAPISPPTP
jgi:hypothetical protein